MEGGAAPGGPPAGSGRRLTESALNGPRTPGPPGWASLLLGPLAPLAERHDDAETASSGSGVPLLPYPSRGDGRRTGALPPAFPFAFMVHVVEADRIKPP